MRIRHFIAALMILLSFSAQARTVFACAMMPGATQEACCCADAGKDRCPQGMAGAACCDEIAPADAPFAHAAVEAGGQHAQHAAPEQLAFGPAPHLLPASFDTGDGSTPLYLPASSLQPSAPLYLLTARLRL